MVACETGLCFVELHDAVAFLIGYQEVVRETGLKSSHDAIRCDRQEAISELPYVSVSK